MNEDRDNAAFVRRAFTDTRQAPEPGLTQRVLARTAERRTASGGEARGRRPGPLLAAAAIGLAVVTVVVLLAGSGRIHLVASQPAPAGPPVGSPIVVGPVPDPAIVYPGSLAAKGAPEAVADWNGKLLDVLPGTVRPNQVSADGSLLAQYAAAPDQGSSTFSIFDRRGRLLSRVGSLFGSWSADGAHVSCMLEGAKAGASMTTIDFSNPRAPRQRSLPVRKADGSPLAGAWIGVGCSARSGRLVAAEAIPGTAKGAYTYPAVAVIDLSTGRVLSQRSFAGTPPVIGVAVSPDARYLARSTSPTHADIVDLGTGGIVGQVAGQVCAFSGDGSLVLTTSSGCGSGFLIAGGVAPAPHVTLVEWSSGRQVWNGLALPTAVAVEPGGTDVALIVYQSAQTTSAVIVRGDGTTIPLPVPPVR